jgi:hypothetical protein
MNESHKDVTHYSNKSFYVIKKYFFKYILFYFQVRTYKKQIEEAEEIATLNLAKFRKTQVDLQVTQP